VRSIFHVSPLRFALILRNYLLFSESKSRTSRSRTTSKSATPSSSPTPPDVMPKSNSRRPRCPLLSDWSTGGPEGLLWKTLANFVLPIRNLQLRLTHNYSLMMKGRNNGKKLMALRIVAHAFEIIHLLTDQNPLQVPFALIFCIWSCLDLPINTVGSRRCHRQHRSP
jgi:hypothetical protein